MKATNQTTKIIIQSKSMAVGIVLALLFGPMGLFYSTVPGAILMLVLSIPIMLLSLGFGLIIILPVCAGWAAIAISNHNKKLVGG